MYYPASLSSVVLICIHTCMYHLQQWVLKWNQHIHFHTNAPMISPLQCSLRFLVFIYLAMCVIWHKSILVVRSLWLTFTYTLAGYRRDDISLTYTSSGKRWTTSVRKLTRKDDFTWTLKNILRYITHNIFPCSIYIICFNHYIEHSLHLTQNSCNTICTGFWKYLRSIQGEVTQFYYHGVLYNYDVFVITNTMNSNSLSILMCSVYVMTSTSTWWKCSCILIVYWLLNIHFGRVFYLPYILL